jgi:hypothetical protein
MLFIKFRFDFSLWFPINTPFMEIKKCTLFYIFFRPKLDCNEFQHLCIIANQLLKLSDITLYLIFNFSLFLIELSEPCSSHFYSYIRLIFVSFLCCNIFFLFISWFLARRLNKLKCVKLFLII